MKRPGSASFCLSNWALIETHYERRPFLTLPLTWYSNQNSPICPSCRMAGGKGTVFVVYEEEEDGVKVDVFDERSRLLRYAILRMEPSSDPWVVLFGAWFSFLISVFLSETRSNGAWQTRTGMLVQKNPFAWSLWEVQGRLLMWKWRKKDWWVILFTMFSEIHLYNQLAEVHLLLPDKPDHIRFLQGVSSFFQLCSISNVFETSTYQTEQCSAGSLVLRVRESAAFSGGRIAARRSLQSTSEKVSFSSFCHLQKFSASNPDNSDLSLIPEATSSHMAAP